VSAAPYFSARLCGEGHHDIVNFEKWFGLVWNSCSVISLGLIIFGQAISDYWKKRNTVGSTIMTSHVLLDGSGTNSSNNNRADASEDDSSRGSNSTGGSGNTAAGSSHDHSFLLVMVPLMMYLSVFGVQAGLVLVPQILPQSFLTLTMIGLAVCGTCGAIASAGIVSTAGLFPSSLGINPFFEGQAVGGVLVSIANFATAVFQDPTSYWDEHCTASNITNSSSASLLATTRMMIKTTPIELDISELQKVDATCSPYRALDWSVFVYFCAGCIVLLLCLVGYHHIHKYQESWHRDDYEVIHDAPPPNQSRDNPGNLGSITAEVASDISPRIGLELNDRISDRESDRAEVKGGSLRNGTIGTSEIEGSSEADGIFRDDTNTGNASVDEEYTDEVDEVAVFSAIKGPATCIFLVFTVTLGLFPSFTSELASNRQCMSHFRLHNDLYVPFTFVFFNIGDLVGRMLAEKVPVQRIRHLSRKLVILATLRLTFLPIFLLCNTNLSSSTSSSFVIRSDLFSLVVLFTFAITNGLLVSTAFMHAPNLVPKATEMQERMSEMMTFAVYFGLLSGSMLAFPFMKLATNILSS